MKTLLTGKPYVNAAATDLRRTFRRIRAEQKSAAARKERADAEIKAERDEKVRPLTTKGA